MPLANEIITRALEKALRQDSFMTPFTASELNVAIDEMNDMMAEFNGVGIALGYSTVTNPTDETNLPAFALSMVKSNLAVRLSNEFGRQLPPGLASQAIDGLDFVRNRISEPIIVNFPDTLPVGQAQRDELFNTSKFFRDKSRDDRVSQSGQSRQNQQGIQLDVETIPDDLEETT